MLTIAYGNNNNVGDYLSARGINLLMGRPAEMFPFEGREREFASRVAAASPEDLFIIGGGGLLMDFFDPFWALFLDAAGQSQTQYVLWGVGACDHKYLDSKPDADLLQAVVSGARLAAIRDPQSYAPFAHLPQTIMVPCPSTSAVTDACRRFPNAIADRLLLQVDHPGLVEQYAVSTAQPDALDQITQICSDAAERSGLVHVRSANRNYRPRGRIGQRYRRYTHRWRQPQRAQKASEWVLASRYLPARHVVTSRLHGAIMGLSAGKKVAAFSSDSKIDAFFDLVGLGDWVCDNLDDLHRLTLQLDEQPAVGDRIRAIRDENAAFAEKVAALYEGRTR